MKPMAAQGASRFNVGTALARHPAPPQLLSMDGTYFTDTLSPTGLAGRRLNLVQLLYVLHMYRPSSGEGGSWGRGGGGGERAGAKAEPIKVRHGAGGKRCLGVRDNLLELGVRDNLLELDERDNLLELGGVAACAHGDDVGHRVVDIGVRDG